MARLNATTPQLKVLDQMFEGYNTRDVNNAAPFLSKNYIHMSFPKIADLPDQKKEGHLEMFGPMFAKLDKLDHVFHEVIEAPGKVVLQWTGLCTLPGGAVFEYGSVSIVTFVEEDGELKVLEFKDFPDPEKRSSFHKMMSQGGQIA